MSDESVTIENIDQSLEQLLDVAGRTDLLKSAPGVAIDQYGHVDERGKTGGGYPSKGDHGGLDHMMIGKMQQSLVDAGFDAGAIAAFMSKKKDDEEEEEEEDGGDAEEFGKSLTAFFEDPEIAEAIEVSPFMESLVQTAAEQIGALEKSLSSQTSAQQVVNAKIAQGLHSMGLMLKSMAPVVEALNERLKLVERTPQQPRGVRSQTRARALTKGMGAPQQQQQEQLSKSQVLSTLSYMNLEKGIKHVGGVPTTEIIGLYEGGGDITPRALHAVNHFIANNPNEAADAVLYR